MILQSDALGQVNSESAHLFETLGLAFVFVFSYNLYKSLECLGVNLEDITANYLRIGVNASVYELLPNVVFGLALLEEHTESKSWLVLYIRICNGIEPARCLCDSRVWIISTARK